MPLDRIGSESRNRFLKLIRAVNATANNIPNYKVNSLFSIVDNCAGMKRYFREIPSQMTTKSQLRTKRTYYAPKSKHIRGWLAIDMNRKTQNSSLAECEL